MTPRPLDNQGAGEIAANHRGTQQYQAVDPRKTKRRDKRNHNILFKGNTVFPEAALAAIGSLIGLGHQNIS